MRGKLAAVVLVGVLAAAGLTSGPGLAQSSLIIEPDTRPGRFIRTLVRDEVEGFLTGKQTLLAFPGSPRVGVIVTANELTTRFRENELAADRSIRDTLIIVTGSVTSVRMDTVTRRPVTQLATGIPQMLLPIQARMARDSEDAAALFRAGQRVRLICTGEGKGLLGIELKECRDADAFLRDLQEKADREISEWMRNGTPPTSIGMHEGGSEPWQRVLFIYYVNASKLPPAHACFRPQLTPQCFSTFELRLSRKSEQDAFAKDLVAAYDANRERLRLPARLVPSGG